MLLRLVQDFNKKQSKEEYKKTQQTLGRLFAGIGAILLIVSLVLPMKEFASGFLMGVGAGLIILGVASFIKLRNEKTLTYHYVAAYDERNKKIRSCVAQVTVGALLVFITILVILYAFWSIQLSYMMTLIVLLYGVIICLAVSKYILSKLL